MVWVINRGHWERWLVLIQFWLTKYNHLLMGTLNWSVFPDALKPGTFNTTLVEVLGCWDVWVFFANFSTFSFSWGVVQVHLNCTADWFLCINEIKCGNLWKWGRLGEIGAGCNDLEKFRLNQSLQYFSGKNLLTKILWKVGTLLQWLSWNLRRNDCLDFPNVDCANPTRYSLVQKVRLLYFWVGIH